MVVAGSHRRVCSRSSAAALAGLLLVMAGSAKPAGAAPVAVSAPVDISGSATGARIVGAAQRRLAGEGFRVPVAALVAWRDASGTLVALRDSQIVLMPVAASVGRGRAELVPVAQQMSGAHTPRAAVAMDDQPIGWTLVFAQCYERISDTWSWLDHCARIYRLAGDADPAHDYYGLQRVATVGANAPWVVKSAAIAATPMDPTLLSWVDWSPRGDRSGPCQSIVVWVTTPFAGLMVPLDRCETWDITKGARGGDFRLDWHGCTCTHDRALAFDIAVSVPQGRSPAWYVPAEVHGFPF